MNSRWNSYKIQKFRKPESSENLIFWNSDTPIHRILSEYYPKTLLVPFILFIGTLILYIHNLSRSVYGGDVGDLVTAAVVGGVPHPPGYPLFTLLGFLLTRFHFATPAFEVGLISAISGALGIAITYLFILHLTKERLLAFVCSLILATTFLYWFYSEIGEVFALHSLFIISLFFLAILYRQTKKRKFLIFFSLLLGLSFTNHQTTILFVPSFLLLIIPSFLKEQHKTQTLLVSCFLLVVSFFVYLYVPFASSHHPPINWDNIHDLNSFLQLLLRKDYGTFQAGLFQKPTQQEFLLLLKNYFFTIFTQLSIPVTFVSIVGIGVLLKKDKILALSFLLAFLLSGPIFVAYSGFPLFGNFFFGVYERFFIMSMLVFFFFFSFGLSFLSHILVSLFQRKIYAALVLLIFLLIPLQLYGYNYQKTNLSHVWIGDSVGRDFLQPFPKNSIVLLGGDTALFNTQYVHYALHVREDIRLVNMNGIGRDSYFDPLVLSYQKSHPGTNPGDDVTSVIREVSKTRDVFAYDQLEPKDGEKLTWEPYGLLFRLIPAQVLSKQQFIDQSINIWKQLNVPAPSASQKVFGDLTIADIPTIYATALLTTGNYLIATYQDYDTALLYYLKAKMLDPNNPKVSAILGVYYLTHVNDCVVASQDFEQSISLDPSQKIPYFLLYTTYKTCLNNLKQANSVVKRFDSLFGKDFFVELKQTIKDKKE